MRCLHPVLQVFLAGNNKTNTDFQNKCDINSISSPDNLFVANGNLIIAEDTTYHFNNYLWAYNFNTGEFDVTNLTTWVTHCVSKCMRAHSKHMG